MSKQINLLVENRSVKKTIKRSFLYTVFFLIGIVMISIIIMIYNMSLSNQFENLSKKERDIISKINSYSVKQKKIVKLNDRLTAINKTLAERMKLDDQMLVLLDLMPDSVPVDSIIMTTDNIQLTTSSDSLYNLSLITSEIEKPGKKLNGFAKADLSSLRLDTTTGFYILNISYYFDKAVSQ